MIEKYMHQVQYQGISYLMVRDKIKTILFKVF